MSKSPRHASSAAAAPSQPPRQHGLGGAYVGGQWVDIEDCATQFNIQNGSDKLCGGDCSTCPRSRSRKSAQKPDGTYDVIVIGAGCIGAAIARELSKTTASVLWLEAADDVTQGATKGNSGIVHAGFDDAPGSVRAKFCWPGNQMFPQLDRDLHFGYVRNGSMVLARSADDVKHLHELKARGEKNGVRNLRILDRAELRAIEPHVHEACVAALYSPDAGTVTPYEFAIALAENAVDNGVELRIRREVTAIEALPAIGAGAGAGAGAGFQVTARHWEPSAYIQNAASSGARLSAGSMVGALAAVAAPLLLVVGAHVAPARATALTGAPAATLITVGGTLLAIIVVALLGLLGRGGRGGGRGFGAASDLKPVGGGGRQCTVEEMKTGGSGSAGAVDGQAVGTETYRARFVVNAAGSASDRVSAMIGDTSFKIKPRIGDYLLLHRDQGYLANTTLFPCPGPLGKGVLVQSTLWGNLILGPTARDMHVAEHAAQTPAQINEQIMRACKSLVPAFDPKKVIHAFGGARAKSDRGDWIIEPSAVNGQFIQVAGIDSPGLAGSPAIAIEAVRLLRAAGLDAGANAAFNSRRAPLVTPKPRVAARAGTPGALKMTPEYRRGEATRGLDPRANVVCKCEKVTEAEVVAALHRSLPIDSTQAIRKRTRAGMGHCQGDSENYDCECRVADIIARELNLPAAAVGRRPWPATTTLPQRWLSDAQKADLKRLAE